MKLYPAAAASAAIIIIYMKGSQYVMAVLADKHERYSIRCMTHRVFALSPGDRQRERNGTGRAILDVHIGS